MSSLLAGLAPLSTPQGAMAAVFCAMATPCLTHPSLILRLFIAPRLQPATPAATELAHLLMRCFGAQALLCGLAIANGGVWRGRAPHVRWIAAIAPFFVFDAMAARAGMLSPLGAIGDAAGNAVFVAASLAALAREK